MNHTIARVPDGGVLAELFCVAFAFGASSGPQDNLDTAQDWALRHTGRNPGHTRFRREHTDHARVIRAE
ncbi:hypothetical protein [Streptomyces sp. NPDC086838]|uniref:DUF7848 domain-containing protein n=1 Tax=Streptomyces sp. NPDC086838 TaxID=3365762 RepID=UPI0037F2662E